MFNIKEHENIEKNSLKNIFCFFVLVIYELHALISINRLGERDRWRESKFLWFSIHTSDKVWMLNP